MNNSFLISLVLLTTHIVAQNCSAPSAGLIPINDLGPGIFNGWMGGLYTDGSNEMPETHQLSGIHLAHQVQCLNQEGIPSSNGKIVWLSIGMSNCTQETQKFIPLAINFPGRNPSLIFVDGAQGGQTANIISTPNNAGYANFWNTVNARLQNAGATNKQVQVIWLKEANPVGTTPVKNYYDSLVVQFKRIAKELKVRFPNVKLCYVSSRLSARYATTTLNPEPHAYYTGWAIKKLIEDQINDDPQLNYKGAQAVAPWLAWGIYMWSDGEIPQKTNSKVFWNCPADFNSDGTHPSNAGAQKVASLLLDFFSTDTTATSWFLGESCNLNTAWDTNKVEKMNFDVFPNPTKGLIHINVDNPIANYIFDFTSVFGKKMLTVLDKNTMDISSCPQGVYFLTVRQGVKFWTRKVLKL